MDLPHYPTTPNTHSRWVCLTIPPHTTHIPDGSVSLSHHIQHTYQMGLPHYPTTSNTFQMGQPHYPTTSNTHFIWICLTIPPHLTHIPDGSASLSHHIQHTFQMGLPHYPTTSNIHTRWVCLTIPPHLTHIPDGSASLSHHI